MARDTEGGKDSNGGTSLGREPNDPLMGNPSARNTTPSMSTALWGRSFHQGIAVAHSLVLLT